MITGEAQTSSGHLPLTAMDVRGEIEGLLYSLTITQTYVNPFEQPLEVTYIFPLPPRAAVAGYFMQVAGRRVEGQLQKRFEARKAYDAAIAAGQRASIAEQERADIFTVRAANLAPGETLEVHLSLEGPLALEGQAACFRLPLVVGQRYLPGRPLEGKQVGRGAALDTTAVPDASRISPPVLLPGHPNPVRLSLEIDVDPADLKFNNLECSLHEVDFHSNGRGGYRVVLGPAERLNRDFILRLHFQTGALKPSLIIGPDSTFLLTIVPPQLGLPQRGRDLVIVLDRSGSMAGSRMAAARRAAMQMVESLTGKDRFGLVTFDTEAEMFRPKMEAAHDEAKVQALEFLKKTDVRGGTEMLVALKACESLLRSSEGQRSLILITDGDIGDQDRVVRWAGQHADVRLFTIGIGQVPGLAVLDRLASQSGGTCQMVESEKHLEKAIIDLHRRVGQPVLRDVTISGAHELTPQRRDVFPGLPAMFFGQFKSTGIAGLVGKILKRGSVSVRATTPDGKVYQESIQAHVSSSQRVSRAWARARILDLEDQFAGGQKEVQKIEALSLEYGVLSRFTALVAVDEQRQSLEAPLHRVVQPVESGNDRKPESVVQLMQVDQLSVTLGFGLLHLVDPKAGAPLLYAVPQLRRQIWGRLGICLPGIRFRDDARLSPLGYRITIKDVEVASGDGVLDPALILQHLARVILAHAHELLGRADLLDLAPNLPKHPALGPLHAALRDLLRQQVSIQPLERILELWEQTQDVEEIRRQLDVCSTYLDLQGALPVLEYAEELDDAALAQINWPPVILTSAERRLSIPGFCVLSRAELPAGMTVRTVLWVGSDGKIHGPGAEPPVPVDLPDKKTFQLRDRVTLSLEGQLALLEMRKAKV